MNKVESLALYKKGAEAWNIWAKEMLAIKARFERLEQQRQTDSLRQSIQQATKVWFDKSSVDFSEYYFEEKVDFSDFIFPVSVRFDKSIFSGNAMFRGATFNGNAKFDKATFSGDALFDNVIISGNAMFDKATFSGDALFDNAIISGLATFDKATFSSDTKFRGAKFSGSARFSDVTFSGKATFSHATFSGNAWFNQTLFKDLTNFQTTCFEKRSDFSAINALSLFSFNTAEFHLVPDFNQAHFIEAPQFDSSDFSKALNSRYKQNNNLSSCWRSLKRLAIQGHDHEREFIFFAEEIKSQRGIQDKALPNLLNCLNNKPVWQGGTRYWFGFFYQYLSDFGRSIMRPLLGLLILGVLSHFFYLYPIKLKSIYNDPVISCERSEAATYLSARSALPFLTATGYSENINRSYACLYGKNNDKKANMPNEVVFFSISQSILSTILIFLLLLALRNHFRIN